MKLIDQVLIKHLMFFILSLPNQLHILHSQHFSIWMLDFYQKYLVCIQISQNLQLKKETECALFRQRKVFE